MQLATFLRSFVALHQTTRLHVPPHACILLERPPIQIINSKACHATQNFTTDSIGATNKCLIAICMSRIHGRCPECGNTV